MEPLTDDEGVTLYAGYYRWVGMVTACVIALMRMDGLI